MQLVPGPRGGLLAALVAVRHVARGSPVLFDYVEAPEAEDGPACAERCVRCGVGLRCTRVLVVVMLCVVDWYGACMLSLGARCAAHISMWHIHRTAPCMRRQAVTIPRAAFLSVTPCLNRLCLSSLPFHF